MPRTLVPLAFTHTHTHTLLHFIASSQTLCTICYWQDSWNSQQWIHKTAQLWVNIVFHLKKADPYSSEDIAKRAGHLTIPKVRDPYHIIASLDADNKFAMQLHAHCNLLSSAKWVVSIHSKSPKQRLGFFSPLLFYAPLFPWSITCPKVKHTCSED